MKKIIGLYKEYMIRPIIYKTTTKISIMLAIALLWNYFINKSTVFYTARDSLMIVGIIVILFAWFNYLKLDGIKVMLFSTNKDGKRKVKHKRRDIIDFVDEKIISFDELEADEQIACSLLSNLIAGALLILLGIISSII